MRINLSVLSLFLALLLFGCGIKPSSVEPPDGSDSGFPRSYPDASTDPLPVGPPPLP